MRLELEADHRAGVPAVQPGLAAVGGERQVVVEGGTVAEPRLEDEAAITEGDAPAGFLPVEPSLEDAYFVLTREDVGRELPA